jgi:hypothetical protein
MQLPHIHLNGTSAQSLLDQYVAAGQAVHNAVTALSAVDVNGRDYYPISSQATSIAVSEHRERLDKLRSVHSDLQRIAEHIGDKVPDTDNPIADAEERRKFADQEAEIRELRDTAGALLAALKNSQRILELNSCDPQNGMLGVHRALSDAIAQAEAMGIKVEG